MVNMLPYIQAAAFLATLTDDPMLVDSIRVLTTRAADPAQVDQARRYIHATYGAYLTLYRNSGTHRLHEFQLDTHPPGDCGD